MNNRLKKQIDFIVEIDKLKSIFRQSKLAHVSRFENDTEHSWHISVMAILLLEHANDKAIDLIKILKMVLIHDIVEIDAGDVIIYDLQRRKEIIEKENAAAQRLFGILPGDQRDEFISLWKEFEAKETNEAKFAGAVDRIEPILLNYLNQGYTWQKNNINSKQVFERNRQIQEASSVLWEYVKGIINESVEKGYLKNE